METSFDNTEWISVVFACCQGPAGDGRAADTVFHPVLISSCLQLNENPVKDYLTKVGAGQPFSVFSPLVFDETIHVGVL